MVMEMSSGRMGQTGPANVHKSNLSLQKKKEGKVFYAPCYKRPKKCFAASFSAYQNKAQKQHLGRTAGTQYTASFSVSVNMLFCSFFPLYDECRHIISILNMEGHLPLKGSKMWESGVPMKSGMGLKCKLALHINSVALKQKVIFRWRKCLIYRIVKTKFSFSFRNLKTISACVASLRGKSMLWKDKQLLLLRNSCHLFS